TPEWDCMTDDHGLHGGLEPLGIEVAFERTLDQSAHFLQTLWGSRPDLFVHSCAVEEGMRRFFLQRKGTLTLPVFEMQLRQRFGRFMPGIHLPLDRGAQAADALEAQPQVLREGCNSLRLANRIATRLNS